MRCKPWLVETSAGSLTAVLSQAGRSIGAAAVSAMLMLVTAVDVGAQPTVLGGVGAQPPAPGGVGAEPAAPGGAQPWSLGAGANAMFESFTIPPGTGGASESFGSQFFVNLVHNWLLRRGAVMFSGNANQYFYSLQGEPLSLSRNSQFMYGMGMSLSYAISPRVSWTVNDTLSSSYARDLTTLSDAALLPPRVLTRYNTVSNTLSYAVSPRTSINWGVGFTSLSTQSSLPPTSTLVTTLTLSRQTSRAQTVGAMATYSSTITNGTFQNFWILSGTWQRQIKKITLNASGGAAAFRVSERSGLQVDPVGSGGISFNAHLVRNDTFGVNYNRSLSQIIGVGLLQTQGVSATYGLSFGERMTVAGTLGYQRGSPPHNSGPTVSGRNAGVIVGTSLTRNLRISVNYTVYKTEAAYASTDRPAFLPGTNRVAFMSLAYGTRWR